MPKIAIIGAGITGLTTAYNLKKKGFSVDVFEKSSVPGGVIQTINQNGFLCELGPSTLQLNDSRILDLLNELGLQKDILDNSTASQERYIVKNAVPIKTPRSPIGFLKTRLFSTKAKLRFLKEPFVKKEENPGESVAAFIERRLGQEFLDYAVDPFVSGVYAGDPSKLSIQYAFPKLYDLEASAGSLIKGIFKKKKDPFKIKTRTISFRNGMKTLPYKIAEALQESLHLQSTILSISKRGQYWEISYESEGSEKTTSYSDVIITIPAHQLKELPLDSSILNELIPIKNIIYSPIAIITHALKKQSIPNPPTGFGMLVPSKENIKILGTLFTSSMFPTHACEDHITLRSFIGGSRHANIHEESAESIENMVWNDLVALLNITEVPVHSHVHVWKYAIPQYNLGYDEILAAINKVEKNFPGFHLMGNYRTGISLPQCILAGLNSLKILN